MPRSQSSLVTDLISASVLLASIALIVFFARSNRVSDDVDGPAREVIRPPAPGVPIQPPPAPENPGKAMQDELRKSEASAKEANQALEKMRADIEAKQAELQKLSRDSEATAARNRQETEEAIRKMAAERDKFEIAAKEASEQARRAREDMEKQEVAMKKQREQAAAAGIGQGFGRGRMVEMQTRFDPRTKRDPLMVPTLSVSSRPAGVGEFSAGRQAINFETARSMSLDNRLKATETFFEMRRINRAARAQEAGPRPTLEQVVRMARIHAPRPLDDMEFDPLTGAIFWPLALRERLYDPKKTEVEKTFRERAGGLSVDYPKYERLKGTILALKDLLKSRVDRYASHAYGKAQSFLDSLLYDYEKPLK